MNPGESPDRLQALAQIDSASERIRASAGTLRFGISQSSTEREAVFRLRYETVNAMGWARPEDYPDGLERDAYDDEATQIVAWDGEILAATARVVYPQPGLRLPTEAAFELEIPPPGQVADWGRFVVAPAYRSRQHRIFWGLLARCWLETRRAGHSEVCGILSQSMLTLYRSMGIEFDVIGPGHRYWNEERFPCKLDVIASAGGITHNLDLPASKKEIP